MVLFMHFDKACDTRCDHVSFVYNRNLVASLLAHLAVGRRKVSETFFDFPYVDWSGPDLCDNPACVFRSYIAGYFVNRGSGFSEIKVNNSDFCSGPFASWICANSLLYGNQTLSS